MKNSIAIILALFMLTATATLSAQTRTNATKTAVLASKQIKTTKYQARNSVKYVNPRQLKEGRNVLQLSKTNLEFVKQRGKVVSVRVISPSGRKGPNLVAKDPGAQKFICTGSICFCFGDNDCNNMFTSNVCKDCIDCAGCVGDDCYCEQN